MEVFEESVLSGFCVPFWVVPLVVFQEVGGLGSLLLVYVVVEVIGGEVRPVVFLPDLVLLPAGISSEQISDIFLLFLVATLVFFPILLSSKMFLSPFVFFIFPDIEGAADEEGDMLFLLPFPSLGFFPFPVIQLGAIVGLGVTLDCVGGGVEIGIIVVGGGVEIGIVGVGGLVGAGDTVGRPAIGQKYRFGGSKFDCSH